MNPFKEFIYFSIVAILCTFLFIGIVYFGAGYSEINQSQYESLSKIYKEMPKIAVQIDAALVDKRINHFELIEIEKTLKKRCITELFNKVESCAPENNRQP